MTARDIIADLGMTRHPEGGWYVQTYTDPEQVEGRARSTVIYYLLEAGEHSAWHRIDAVEVWHYYAGAPLELRIAAELTPDQVWGGAETAAGPVAAGGRWRRRLAPRRPFAGAGHTGAREKEAAARRSDGAGLDESMITHELGPDLKAGQRPQVIVPRHHWQAAKSLGDFTLAGCTVAPGFLFEGFEMAPEGWQPG